MSIDFDICLHRSKTAILVSECQEAVLGDRSPLTGLCTSARAGDVVAHITTLLEIARQCRVPVFHCLVTRRADGWGDALNTPITAMMAREAGPGSGMATGSPGAQPIPELAPQQGDVVLQREHGITAFHETGLDHFLRASGIENVVFTGVSLNLAVFGGSVEAVNRGYRVVIPEDCVAADPPEYGELLLRHSLRNIAYITRSEEIRRYWTENPG